MTLTNGINRIALSGFKSIEHVDLSLGSLNVPETAPSKRLFNIVPRYRKARHGPMIADRIGLVTLRDRCPLFSAWLSQLETASL